MFSTKENRKTLAIDPKLIDQLLAEHPPEDIAGKNGLLKQLNQALLERAMEVELTHHLGYRKHDLAGDRSRNSRNGKTKRH
jgi:transposase-like protein